MACVFIHLVPGAVLLLPDDHLPVVGAGRQDVAVHGVSPGHLPHRTLMTAQRDRMNSNKRTKNKLRRTKKTLIINHKSSLN